MQQLTFIKPGVLEWRELDEPKLESRSDALVRPVAITTCDADIALIRGEAPIPGPFPFGHEFVSEIVDCGDEVSGFEPGQLVVVPVQISCGECARCKKGMTAFCRGVKQPASWGLGALGGNWPGAFCDLLRVPFASHMLVPIPQGISLQASASVGDNVADAWRTVAPPLRRAPGAKVLIVGRGSIGLYGAAIAHTLGAEKVDYLDNDAGRLALAQSLGANPIEGPAGERVGSYPITVDASFSALGLNCALRSLEPGGYCTSVGVYFQDTPLPLFEMWRRSVTFHTGVANCRANMPQVFDLIRSGKIHPELVTSEVLAWDEAPRALANPSMKPLFLRKQAGN